MKNRKNVISVMKKKKLVEAVRYVDLVIPEENWDQKISDVKEYHVDTFVMGDDWKGKFDFLKEEGCEVVYLHVHLRSPVPRSRKIFTQKNSRIMTDRGYASVSSFMEWNW